MKKKTKVRSADNVSVVLIGNELRTYANGKLISKGNLNPKKKAEAKHEEK